jgi:hypothetical protein
VGCWLPRCLRKRRCEGGQQVGTVSAQIALLFVTTSWIFVNENSLLWVGEGLRRRWQLLYLSRQDGTTAIYLISNACFLVNMCCHSQHSLNPMRYNIFSETAILSPQWASYGVNLSKIRICGDKMETRCPLKFAVVFQVIKRELGQRFQEEIRPPIDRLLCTKSITIYAQHAAIEPKLSVQWFKM